MKKSVSCLHVEPCSSISCRSELADSVGEYQDNEVTQPRIKQQAEQLKLILLTISQQKQDVDSLEAKVDSEIVAINEKVRTLVTIAYLAAVVVLCTLALKAVCEYLV